MSKQEAEERSKALYHATKGCKQPANLKSIGLSRIYTGGTESFMFNILESIAHSQASKTPALSAEISDALISDHVQEEFLTSRVNWAVQSSGVDYLHMLVCTMDYLLKRYGIKGRLAITIHDEVRYLIAEHDKHRGALALQIANIWTRAMFARRVGMTDLPLVRMFYVMLIVFSR
jgi:DNA polymerase gamma 1